MYKIYHFIVHKKPQKSKAFFVFPSGSLPNKNNGLYTLFST